jgi:hypothetical protein
MGTRQKLESYMIGAEGELGRGYVIKKAWLEDIMAGVMLGGAYAFDEEAYKMFYPRAQRAGLSVGGADFSLAPPAGLGKEAMHLVRVQIVPGGGG